MCSLFVDNNGVVSVMQVNNMPKKVSVAALSVAVVNSMNRLMLVAMFYD